MHNEAQLRQAAKIAGVRVLSIRRVQTPFGEVVCGRYEAPSNEEKFRFLVELAKIDVGDPCGRSLGLQVRNKLGPDEHRMARAIQRWVQKNVVYLQEPTETFQAPWFTARAAVGDCDDHANLVHSIARNAGMDARVVAVRNKAGTIRHACTQLSVDGQWCWLETTLDADFDEPPKAAAKRLRAAREDVSS